MWKYVLMCIYIYIFIWLYTNIYICLDVCKHIHSRVNASTYGVATISGLLQITGLFCRIQALC